LNILIFNPSFIGDSILTTPLIKATKHYFPDSKITFVVRPESAPLFEGLDFIHEVLPFDKRGKDKGLGGALKFAKKLRERDFDIAISAHTSLRSSIVIAKSGAKKKVGFSLSKLATIYDYVELRDFDKFEVLRNLELLKSVAPGFDIDEAKDIAGKPSVYVDPETEKKAKEEIEKAAKGRPIVGINPGSVWPTKRWPAERFGEVADILHDKGIFCVVIGAPSDEEIVEKMKSAAKHPFYNLCGKTKLNELPAYIKQFHTMITNDSGPMHIATAVGTPNVAIFGPTVRELGFFPYDDDSMVIEVSLGCRPCGLHGGKKCPKKHFCCMLNIKPDEVATHTIKILEGNEWLQTL